MGFRTYQLDDLERLWVLALIDSEQQRMKELGEEYVKDRIVGDLDTFSKITQDHHTEEERLQKLFEYLKSEGGERNDRSSASNV